MGILASAILGAIVASFVNVIVERVNTGQSWFSGRSRCTSCRVTLKGYDLIPGISWIVLLGRCRSCGSRIPVRLVLSELLLAAVFGAIVWRLGLSIEAAVLALFSSVLLGLVLYDIRHTIVPPLASGTLVVLAVVFSFLVMDQAGSLFLTYLTAGVISLGFFLLYALSKGRAMGLGDTPVSLALALVSAPYAFGGLLLSFWIGALVGIVILVLRRGGPTMGIEVPFVPFLALGFLLAYFFQWNPFLTIV